MRVAIAPDHARFELKKVVRSFMAEGDGEILDLSSAPTTRPQAPEGSSRRARRPGADRCERLESGSPPSKHPRRCRTVTARVPAVGAEIVTAKGDG